MKRYIKVGMFLMWLSAALFCRQDISLCANAEFNSEDAFSEGNSLYRHNQYDAALSEYGKILHSGLESGNLYYNVGNSYFKKGELGLAVLNYERARFLIPGDSDLRSNYDYARSQLNLSSDALPGNWFSRNLDKVFSNMNMNTLMLTLSLFYLFILIELALRVFLGSRLKFYKTALAVLVLILFLSGFAFYRRIEFFHKGAVVTVKEIEAKFEPLDKATTYFTLPEGSKVIVVDSSGDWLKVKRQDNKVGWVDRSGISLI
ncbi:MAG: SH3 domain-containing protein [Candidatus Omnitrophica bacterium]|nr:SH3 domain-containing protein [Candidatus Omnitrophota bacterium]